MKKDSLTYKIVYVLLLIGMIGHLAISHPIADGWILCSVDDNMHLENVNLSEDCHFKTEFNKLAFSSNCDDDIILKHQDEFYSHIKTLEKIILPVSAVLYMPEIENNILYTQYTSINLLEFEQLPITLKNTVNLLI